MKFAERLELTDNDILIYGEFKREDEQLFRCPKATAYKDLRRFMNSNRLLICPMREGGNADNPFVDDESKDLRAVEGLDMIGYWRMYFDGSRWQGRWLLEGEFSKEGIKEKPDWYDCEGVNRIIDWIYNKFEKGNDFYMKEYCGEHFTEISENRYLIRPYLSENYKIMIDTKYGNNDYPVRIYTYHKDKQIEYVNQDLIDLLRTREKEFIAGMTVEDIDKEREQLFQEYNRNGVLIDWDRMASLNHTKEILVRQKAENEEKTVQEVIKEKGKEKAL